MGADYRLYDWPDSSKDRRDIRHVFWVVIMSKRDIKAKRWLKRRLRREHGEWWRPIFTVIKVSNGMHPAAGERVFVCPRRPGLNTLRAMRDVWCG